MKKVMILIVVPYLVIMGIIFYLFYGPGVFSGYQALKWKDIETVVPSGFTVKPYQSQGWDVYSLKKISVLIKIAVRPRTDVSRMHERGPSVIFRTTPGVGENYYITKPHKRFEVVYAGAMEDGNTIYFSVSGPSVYTGRFIMDKLLGNCFYKGQKVVLPPISVPTSLYVTDFIFLGGMMIPLIIIILVFYLSGAKPSDRHFEGDPIRYEESFVYYSSVRKWRRKNSFCYLALTTSRLMVFCFKKPVVEINLRDDDAEITIDRSKIIIQLEKEKLILRSSNIEKWKEALGGFIH